MAARKRKRAKRMPRSERREQILDAAVRVILTQGLSQCALENVAAEARISKPLIYKYYARQSELLKAVVEREYHYLRRKGLDVFARNAPYEDVVQRSTLLAMEYLYERGPILRLIASDRSVASLAQRQDRDERRNIIDYFTRRRIAYGLPRDVALICSTMTINAPILSARALKSRGISAQRAAQIWAEFIIGGNQALAAKYHRRKARGSKRPRPSRSRVAVVTGASSGVGKAAAKDLVARGWRVIALGRDPTRAALAESQIMAAAPSARVNMLVGDLASMRETARMAFEIAQLTDEVHVLLNNAGGVRSEQVTTPEGNEATFAGNHLGAFLLTTRLMPLLRRAAATSPAATVRIVNVSSTGHETCPGIDWDDLQLTRRWASGRSYCLAKLCNILHARELAKRLAGDGIVVHAMHPGVVASNFINHAEPAMKQYMATLTAFPPEVAADTLVWLATSSEAGQTTGGYFHNRIAIAPSAAALDDTNASRLWDVSEELIARLSPSVLQPAGPP